MGFLDVFIKPEDDSAKQKTDKKSAAKSQLQTPVQPQPAITGYAAPAVDNVMNIQASAIASKPVSSVGTVSSVSSVSMETTETNLEIVKMIWQKILDLNLPGPDYLETKNNAAALESMGLSETQRYEAAFKMLKATYPTFTKDILLNSIDTYVGYANDEAEEGKKQCEEKRAEKIGNRQTLIQQLQTQSDDINKKIVDLQKQQQEAQVQIQTLQTEITTATQEIDREERIFNNSVKCVIDTLLQDKAVMSTLNI